MRSDTADARQSVQFGKEFEIDARALELKRSGRSVRLERIPTQILLFLIEQKGSLVTREEIAEKIWGSNAFLDTDNSINGAIRKIRMVLRDDPQQPRFVETVTGRGYRFIAPVSGEKPQPALSEPDLSGSAEETERDQSEAPVNRVPESKPIERETSEIGASAQGRHPVRFVVLVASVCVLAFGGWLIWTNHRASASAYSRHSIAILPLQNLSGDPAQEYFADGMTEELITELSKIPSLQVISHTSVMEYKGTKKHLPQIARELGVDVLLEGSVIRENNQVRVTVQLLDGPNDRHLWSEAYERPLHGILTLQREVAQAVSREIRIKLSPQLEARFNTVRDVDPEAYEAYERGRYNLSSEYTMAQPLLQAKEYFEQAIRKDPSFAPAYSGLADAHVYLAIFRQEPKENALRSAREALHKAMELDDSMGEIHDTMGIIAWQQDLDWAGAEREFNQAIALAPSYSCAHEDRANLLALTGRRAEALAEMANVHKLDLGPSAANTEANVFYQLRDYPSLVQSGQRGIASNPNDWVEHNYLGIGYEGTDKLPEAVGEYQKAVELSSGDQDASAWLAHAYALSGKRADAEKILRDFEQKSKNSEASPYLMATIWAGLGEKDKALRFLEEAYHEKSFELSWHLKADLRLDNLRSDPGFRVLAERVGIPTGVEVAAN